MIRNVAIASCLLVAVSATLASSDSLESWQVYKKGQSVAVRLVYAGGTKGWNAGFHNDVKHGFGTVNNGFMNVTNSKGKAIPRKGGLDFLRSEHIENQPFNVTVDLAKSYDLSNPGKYVVQWGCRNVKTSTIRIEIVQ